MKNPYISSLDDIEDEGVGESDEEEDSLNEEVAEETQPEEVVEDCELKEAEGVHETSSPVGKRAEAHPQESIEVDEVAELKREGFELDALEYRKYDFLVHDDDEIERLDLEEDCSIESFSSSDDDDDDETKFCKDNTSHRSSRKRSRLEESSGFAPRPQRTRASVGSLTCALCQHTLPYSSYSNTQRRKGVKGENSKCKECISSTSSKPLLRVGEFHHTRFVVSISRQSPSPSPSPSPIVSISIYNSLHPPPLNSEGT